MMKTLCVAVVVLSLTSVCQSASLACEKLLKPVDKGPDLSGRWYLIAVSSDICLAPLVYALWPSIAVNITSKETPNNYDVDLKLSTYGYCINGSGNFYYGNNTIFEFADAPTDEPNVLLQSGCPDCVVMRRNETSEHLLLFSRRQNVSADELKEFETQADCLGWYKPEVLNSGHEYENCTVVDDIIEGVFSLLPVKICQRLKNYTVPLNCHSDKYPDWTALLHWCEDTNVYEDPLVIY
ncbi:uncharacterized protein LOC108873550 [Lates japonicus]